MAEATSGPRRSSTESDDSTTASQLPTIIASEATETDTIVQQISLCAEVGCQEDETSAMVGMTPHEFRLFLIRNPRSLKAFFMGPARGRAKLRGLQMKTAAKGDARMQKWLGKQLLGQTENPADAGDSVKRKASEAWDAIASWRMQRLG